MLCNEYFKEIKLGKEVQIKGLMICKKCVESKPIAYCDTCYLEKKLYYKDKIHESSEELNQGFNILVYSRSYNNSKKIIQCDDCYQSWKKQERQAKKRMKTKEKLLSLLLGFCSYSLLLKG